MSRLARGSFAVAAALLAVWGCSLVNTFDDVVEGSDASTGGTAGSAGSAGTSGSAGGGTGGSSGTGGVAGTSGTGGGGTGGTGGATGGTSGTGGTGGTGGTAGAGGTGGVVVQGAVVVAGDTIEASPKNVLVVLNPGTGEQRSRLQIRAAAVGYDPVRDLWYVFEQTAPSAIDRMKLNVYELDDATGTLTQRGTGVDVPAPIGQDLVAVLNQRILYRSTVRGTSGPPTDGVTLIDTSNPDSVRILGQEQTSIPVANLLALIPHPNTGASLGGTITAAQQGPCAVPTPDGGVPDGGTPPPSQCEVRLSTVTVTAAETVSWASQTYLAGSVPQVGGSAGFAFDPVQGSDVLVFPPSDHTAPDATGVARRFNPLTHAAQGAPVSFPIAGPRISSVAVDPCRQIALAAELITDPAVFAIPLRAGGTPTRADLATAGVRVVYEPYTRTVLRPFDSATLPEITAWVLVGSDTNPTLSRRLAGAADLPWNPPSDLNPKRIVTKQPLPYVCR